MWRKIFIFCFLAVQNVAGYPVILLVLDGFLPSYFSSVSTPNLDSLVKDGVRVSRLQPEFPASRDPFLVSLLTGRHSEDHGVFAHERYSTKLDSLLSVEDAAFWNKTRELGTLWDLVANFRACNWPHAQHLVGNDDDADEGHSDKRILAFKKSTSRPAGNSTPEEAETTDASILDNWNVCVEATAEWLTKTDDVQLVSLYIDEPGTTAEMFGPDSIEVAGAVVQVDTMIGQLVARIRKEKLEDRVNLIVVSSPGYVALTFDHLVDLTAFVKPELFMSIGESPVLNIKPLQKELMVYEELKKGEQSTGRFKVHIKEEFPEVSHYADNEDVQELIVVAEEGFAFAHDMKNRLKELDQRANRSESLKNVYGVSGFNNTMSSMQTLLVGWGPELANGGKNVIPKSIQDAEEPIRVVDLFALLCHLLDVEAPQSIASDKKRVNVLLRYHSDTEVVKVIRNWMSFAFLPENAPLTIAIGICSLLGLLIVASLIICICRRCCWRRKDITLTTGYRYTQVMNNRRLDGGRGDDDDSVQFEGTHDDKQGLLSEVNINDDYDEPAA